MALRQFGIAFSAEIGAPHGRRPVPFKLVETMTDAQVFAARHRHEMIIEGLISIAQGENPRNIETTLSGFLN